MASMSKDVYKTIKRSISATTNSIAATANDVVSNVSNVMGRDSNMSRLSNPSSSMASRHWIHPPRVLTEGHIEYVARFLGKIEVAERQGAHVVRDANHKILFQYEQNKSIAGHSGSKMPKVIIQINVDRLAVVDQKTNKNLFVFPLRRVSYSNDDNEDKRKFSFIARTEDGKHVCFTFLSEKMAEEITHTVAQSFDLLREKWYRNMGETQKLEAQKEILLLQKRVNELQAENISLRAENKGLKCENDHLKMNSTSILPNGSPLLPNTPIPPPPMQRPPTIPINKCSAITPLAPPPQLPSRRAQQSNNGQTAMDINIFSLNEVFQREALGPDVGTRLQNLRMDQMEDLFDDEFNPRAGEKNGNGLSSVQESNENGNEVDRKSNEHVDLSTVDANNTTVEQFEALLKQIDERLANVQEERKAIDESGRDSTDGDVSQTPTAGNTSTKVATPKSA